MKVNQNMSKKTEVIFKFITNSNSNVVKKIIFLIIQLKLILSTMILIKLN